MGIGRSQRGGLGPRHLPQLVGLWCGEELQRLQRTAQGQREPCSHRVRLQDGDRIGRRDEEAEHKAGEVCGTEWGHISE